MSQNTPDASGKARKTDRRGRQRHRSSRLSGGIEPAVRGGLSGGRMRPLGQRDIINVHKAVLEVLETVGIGEPSQDLLDIVLPRGCWQSPQGRLCFPPALVEEMIAAAASEFTVHARGDRSPDRDARFGGTRVYYGIGAEAVSILDPTTRRYRPTTIADLYDLTRIIDLMDNIHIAGQMAQPSDIKSPLEQDLNTIYAIASATEKPFSISFRHRRNIAPGLELLDMIAGGAGKYKERPFCTSGPIAIIGPLRFEPDGLEILIESARLGLYLDASCGPMAAATGPASLAGTLVQGTAEMLASIVIANIINPGLPIFFAPWPFITDVRSGAIATGAGEAAILGAAYAQIGNYYDLPTSQGSCMTDSKIPDAQAGYEKGIAAALLAQAGSNRIQACSGTLASIKCCAHEALIIDNDMLGMALRTVRGLEVSDETLSVDVIRECALNPGHYLGHAQTLSLMESQFHYPLLADRRTPDLWEEAGSPTSYEQAADMARDILSRHFPNHFSAALDEDIRRKWPIHLPASYRRKQ
ncbi:MAG: trimethylamine methyltransferase [Rhodobacteraceae bacterium]|nr:trimethylamine methyltransferase [Paracoccaceae bacterium]